MERRRIGRPSWWKTIGVIGSLQLDSSFAVDWLGLSSTLPSNFRLSKSRASRRLPTAQRFVQNCPALYVRRTGGESGMLNSLKRVHNSEGTPPSSKPPHHPAQFISFSPSKQSTPVTNFQVDLVPSSSVHDTHTPTHKTNPTTGTLIHAANTPFQQSRYFC